MSRIRICWFCFFGILLSATTSADEASYREAFLTKVHAFANLNRISIGALNRDVHADCYIPLTMSIVIRRDGTVADVSIVETSTVPVVDNWYRWVIRQAAPYAPLAEHYDPVPEQIVMIEEFRLDVRLWSANVRSTRACDPIQPP